MKGKVLVVILLGAVLTGALVVTGVLNGKIIEIQCRYEESDCVKKKYFMKVVSVSDSSLGHLIGKIVSPEIILKQTRLNNFIQSKLSGTFRDEFYLIGYLRHTSVEHCIDAECFRVRKIKHLQDSVFTEF